MFDCEFYENIILIYSSSCFQTYTNRECCKWSKPLWMFEFDSRKKRAENFNIFLERPSQKTYGSIKICIECGTSPKESGRVELFRADSSHRCQTRGSLYTLIDIQITYTLNYFQNYKLHLLFIQTRNIKNRYRWKTSNVTKTRTFLDFMWAITLNLNETQWEFMNSNVKNDRH